jgi:hypothetical protein
MDHESGIAYGFVGVIMLLVVGALVWMMFIPFANGLTDEMNDRAATGDVSAQTFVAFGLALDMYRYGPPVFILLLALYFGIVRALERKKEEGY